MCCKPLQIRNYHRFGASEKNHTKKPTVGFLPFANRRKVVAMMKHKNISGKRKSGWGCVTARQRQLAAADVSRRSGRWRANCARRGTMWTSDLAGLVNQNPPTYVGGYGANSLICR